MHITITRCGHWPGQEQRGERGEERECEHMSVDFVYIYRRLHISGGDQLIGLDYHRITGKVI